MSEKLDNGTHVYRFDFVKNADESSRSEYVYKLLCERM